MLAFTTFFVSVAGLQYPEKRRQTELTARDGNCLHLTLASSGAFVSAPVKLGVDQREVNAVPDTGSTKMLVQDYLKTGSTESRGTKVTLSYGSGDVEVEEASDLLTVGSMSGMVTVFLMEQYTATAFSDIEGILPLSTSYYNYLGSSSFSLCLEGDGGSMQVASGGVTSVSANDRWEVNLRSVRGGSKPSGVNGGTVLTDSGTTLILGPIDGVDSVLASACEDWSNCDSSSEGGAAVAFLKAVEAYGCRGDPQMPSITFDLDGTQVSITGANYAVKYDGKCALAMDYMDGSDYWILGLPVFYEYTVNFDSSRSEIGFTAGSCSSCSLSLAPKSGQKMFHSLDGPARWSGTKPGDAIPSERRDSAGLLAQEFVKMRLERDRRRH